MMRILWDTNVLVAAIAFPKGVASEAMGLGLVSGWENCINLWIDEGVVRILERKFGVQAKWPRLRECFTLLPRVSPSLIMEAAGLLRDPLDASIVAACLRHSVDVLVTGDKDLTEDGAAIRLLEHGRTRIRTPRQLLDDSST